MKTKIKCGGARKGAGRPLTGKAPMKRYNVVLDDETVDKAQFIGGDNLSYGIRRAVTAYKGD